MGATVGAWGRYGPNGTSDLKVVLVPGAHVEKVTAPGAARMSDLRIQPREVPA
jgi:hypothetical protein